MNDSYIPKNFRSFKISGITINGQKVLAGWFSLINSEGISLDVVLQAIKLKGLTPDWISFINDAINFGWNPNSLLSKIEIATKDVYGEEYSNEILKRSSKYIKDVYQGQSK